MPRGVIFHAALKSGAGWDLGPITASSPLYYLRSDGKVLADFALTAIGVSDKVMFDVLLSKHLAPYELARGAKGLLPLSYGPRGWEVRTLPALGALGVSTAGAITKALAANDNETLDQFFARVDTDRKKLTSQYWADDDWLVVASAGGKRPCAAYVRGDQWPCSNTIIDQTLYWGRVGSEDEAIYITALINSPAVCDVIVTLQPRGAFGERHIHKLAFDRTPRFEPTDRKHCAVVKSARALLQEWSTRRRESGIQQCLAPEMHMITRRRKIREALEQLPSWTEYKKATSELYGV